MKESFQIIILVVFIFAAIFGILVFSGAIPIGSSADQTGGLGTVILWGTVKYDKVFPVIQDFNDANPSFVVKYVEKSPDTFDQDLLEALADGTGPDMFLLPDNLVFHYYNKIYTIPYQTYPVATFKSNFAAAGEVFLSDRGTLAFPLTIDPLVMYYNRSMLDANAIVYPPASWDDLVNIVPTLTKKDDSNKITKSAVALGQFSNVTNAKAIISTLFMQAGNPIVTQKAGAAFTSALDTVISKYNLSSILTFYTSFADPSKNIYSWNKSFPNSNDSFSSEDLAFYFGFASEFQSLVNKNPNQNFAVAPIPQIKDAGFKLTGAHVTGLAVSSFSKNLNTAIIAANLMATSDFADKFAKVLLLPPARRDLLAIKPLDPYSPTFYNSALFAKSWLDPSPNDTNNIFRGMVEAVLSNTMTPSNAITDASAKLGFLLLK